MRYQSGYLYDEVCVLDNSRYAGGKADDFVAAIGFHGCADQRGVRTGAISDHWIVNASEAVPHYNFQLGYFA